MPSAGRPRCSSPEPDTPTATRHGEDAGPDSELAAGYAEERSGRRPRGGGGGLDFGPAFRHRLSLYDLYLGLLLVIECGPRGFGSGHHVSAAAASPTPWPGYERWVARPAAKVSPVTVVPDAS
jgi:hypothetical protein